MLIPDCRYWDKAVAYARQNGGDFDFDIDGAGGSMAVPLEARFWTWLLTSKAKAWNLATYEQVRYLEAGRGREC